MRLWDRIILVALLVLQITLAAPANPTAGSGNQPTSAVTADPRWAHKHPLRSGEVRNLPFQSGMIHVVAQPGKAIASALAGYGLAGAVLREAPPFSARDVRAGFDRSFNVPVPLGAEKSMVVTLAADQTNFEFAGLIYTEPNRLHLSPNDSLFTAGYQGNLDAMNVRSAWDRATSWYGIRIAVIDGGLRGTHEEFYGKQNTGRDFTGTDRVNGTPLAPNSNTDVTLGHGTMVTSFAAARTNNSRGVAATGFNSNIIPIKVFSGADTYTAATNAGPVRWAYNNGAHVINMSWGRYSPDYDFQNALREAWLGMHSITNVASAGNDNSTSPQYPCAYEYVICVGASNNSGARWVDPDFPNIIASNQGGHVDVAAPSVGAWYADQEGDSNSHYYYTRGSTSASSPEVAGIAALLHSLGKNANQVYDDIRFTARPYNPAWTAYGMVDAGAALWR